MFREIFVDEYLHSPFLWWGVSMLVFTTFSAFLIFNLVLQAVVINQWYVPILFVSLTFVFVRAVYPIRRGLRSLFTKKETKRYGVMFLAMIGLIYVTEGVFFMSDPYVIFGTLSPEVIKDKSFWEYAINTKTLISFIASPFWQAFSFTIIKTKLIKEGYEIHDTFRNNWKYVICVITVNSVMCGISLTITAR
jgi:hypothetical protein